MHWSDKVKNNALAVSLDTKMVFDKKKRTGLNFGVEATAHCSLEEWV